MFLKCCFKWESSVTCDTKLKPAISILVTDLELHAKKIPYYAILSA